MAIDVQLSIPGANMIAGYAKVREVGQAPNAVIQLLQVKIDLALAQCRSV